MILPVWQLQSLTKACLWLDNKVLIFVLKLTRLAYLSADIVIGPG